MYLIWFWCTHLSLLSSPCGTVVWDLCSGTPHETEYCSQKLGAQEGLGILLPALSPAETIQNHAHFILKQSKVQLIKLFDWINWKYQAGSK